jgi:Fe-S oxidoreductase
MAITGQLGANGFTDPALLEVLDLCLECKACKSECPTNVDMARLKAEFLHQYYRKHGLPWRNRVFGHIAVLSRAACHFGPAANWLTKRRSVRWLVETILGIDRRRALPAFAGRSFRVRLDCKAGCESGRSDRRVLFFCDTFTKYYEPGLATTALRLLETAGCSVELGGAEHGTGSLVCCGRPLISNGLLSQAVRHARHNVDALHPWAVAGNPIIACEPSCILTIKDDYPALLKAEHRRKAETVAAACFTFEQFMESLLERSRSSMQFQPRHKKILVQGHCHQRSLTGMEPTLSLLRRVPGAAVIDLDGGCCGMAGSFGYEKEHYEISRAVGEQRLFPALREAASDAVIVASGFSCRKQIDHFTGRTALHPAELLWSLIGP